MSIDSSIVEALEAGLAVYRGKALVNLLPRFHDYTRGRIKLELKPKADDELETVVSIDRATDFRKWLNA